jgi:endonuclease YncB( thermonuclease family)
MIDTGVRTAHFVRVIDGDTFRARLLLAPRVDPQPTLDASIRVAGWDAAELRDAEGPSMRDEFESILQSAGTITVQLTGMSFQRVVAVVFIDGKRFDGLLHQSLRQLRYRLRSDSPKGPTDDPTPNSVRER